MWFRNLMPYRLTAPWTLSPGALEERLAERPLHACSGLSTQSQGWVSPRDDAQRVHATGRHSLIALGIETKVLPTSVVKDETEARAQAHEARMGYRPGRRQLRELRDQVTAELLPRAFSRRQVTRAWIDAENGWLYVDSASGKRGDDLTSCLRETLGELPLAPLDTAQSASSCMTRWVAEGKAPDNFTLDQDCEMKSGGEDPSAVRFARHALEGDDVRRHVTDGKSVTQLGLLWNDRVRLILADPGIVRRVRFELIDEDRDGADEGLSEDERFDLDFTLMCGELSALMQDLVKVLGGVRT